MHCSIRVRFWFAITGIFVGLSAAPVFALRMRNINATVFALISAVFAAGLAVLHWYYKTERITTAWIPRLRVILLIGCFGQLAGACAFVSYVSMAAVLAQGITGEGMYGENFWIACVWGWMTWKWAFQLFWWARSYRREMMRINGDGSIKYGALDD